MLFGATAIVWLNVTDHLHAQGGWEIHIVSRRPPQGTSYFTNHIVELTDHDSPAAILSKNENATDCSGRL